MKSFSTVLAIALSFSATHVLAQDEANAHDGLLPLTTLPLTNEAGSTTGSQTIFATAVSTATISGVATTIYSDISGIVTPTSAGAPIASTTASAISTSIPAISTPVTTSTSSSLAVIILSGTSSASTASALSTGSLSTITASSGALTSTKASSTKSSTRSSTSSSSTANASGSSDSAGERVVVGGLGVVGAVLAGLMVL